MKVSVLKLLKKEKFM